MSSKGAHFSFWVDKHAVGLPYWESTSLLLLFLKSFLSAFSGPPQEAPMAAFHWLTLSPVHAQLHGYKQEPCYPLDFKLIPAELTFQTRTLTCSLLWTVVFTVKQLPRSRDASQGYTQHVLQNSSSFWLKLTQNGGQKYNISFCKSQISSFCMRSNFFRKYLSLQSTFPKGLQLLYLVSKHLWNLRQGKYQVGLTEIICSKEWWNN